MTPSDLIALFNPRQKRRTFVDVRGRPGTEARHAPGACPTVIAIHGFTGVPGEVELCCEAALDLGLGWHAPLLAGHGKSARELARTRYPDWLKSARPAFDAARAHGPVILVGLSLGSLVAMDLLLSAPGDVDGLVLLSNALWLKPPHPGWTLKLAGLAHLPDFYINKNGPDLGDPSTRSAHVTLDAQPLHAAVSLVEAGERLRGELFRIHRPTLIVHGALDRVCPVENAWRAATALGTRDVRVVVLPRSKHIITRDVERAQLKSELTAFYARVGQNAAPWAHNH